MSSAAKTNQTALGRPTLILTRGIPGSGKSYLATALLKAIGNEAGVILDPDQTDYASKEYLALTKAWAAEGVQAKFFPYRFLRAKAYRAISSRKIIIWNQAFTSRDGFNRTIVNLQAYALERGIHLPLLIIEVEVSHSTAKTRVAQREAQGGHGVSEAAFSRFVNDYTSFASEGYYVVKVNGEGNVAESVAQVIRALKALWRQ